MMKQRLTEDSIKGASAMPAFFGIFMVLLVAFQLFFRYDSWPSKTDEGLIFERDRLTGETHRLKAGDRVGIVARITGDFGHIEDVSSPKRNLSTIPEPVYNPQAVENASPTQQEAYPLEEAGRPDAANGETFTVLARAGANENESLHPAVLEQKEATPEPRRRLLWQTTTSRQSQQPEQQKTPQASQAAPVQRTTIAAAPEPKRPIHNPSISSNQTSQASLKPLATKPSALPAASNPKPVASAYQLNMIASGKSASNSEIQPRTTHYTPIPPSPPASPAKEIFRAIPLVKTASANSPIAPTAASTRHTAAFHKTATQTFDLNHDGQVEQIIQTNQTNGMINISVVSEGKELFFGQGQQLQILPSRSNGWSDLMLLNTASSLKMVYQYDPRTKAYIKTQVIPYRPSVAMQ